MTATKTLTGKTLHMGMDKNYLIGLVHRFGAREALKDFDGTNDEAIALIQADPRTTFTIGPCDNTDETGACQGHPTTVIG